MEAIKERTLKFIKYKRISMKEFEKMCKLSSGYVTSMRKGFGREKLNNVLTAFPELNRDWLIFGEGEMLNKEGNIANGNNNTQVAGNSNNVNCSSTLDKAIDEISEQRKLVSKAQEQIDRMLSIIEDLTSKIK